MVIVGSEATQPNPNPSTSIGQLEYIAAREVWAREDTDMTPWLASPQGIRQLDAAIQLGVDPESVRNEQPVTKGDAVFRADITATTVDGRTVVIENQLEKTDHSHLGQLLTYLANTDEPASSIGVWVTPRPLAEHVQAVEMINRHSELDLLLVEVKAIRVDGGNPTPIFTQITGPRFTIKKASSSKSTSERAEALSGYWDEFIGPAAERLPDLAFNPGTYKSPYLARTILGPANLGFEVWVTSSEFYAHFVANGPDPDQNARVLDALVEHAEAQAPEFSASLEVLPPDGRRSAALRSARGKGDYKHFDRSTISAHIDCANSLLEALLPLPPEFVNRDWTAEAV